MFEASTERPQEECCASKVELPVGFHGLLSSSPSCQAKNGFETKIEELICSLIMATSKITRRPDEAMPMSTSGEQKGMKYLSTP